MSDDVKVESSIFNIMKMNLYFLLVSCDSFWHGDCEMCQQCCERTQQQTYFWQHSRMVIMQFSYECGDRNGCTYSPELSPKLSSPEVWHNDIALFVMFSLGSSGNVVKVVSSLENKYVFAIQQSDDEFELSI